jgi:hypothetical protein
MKRLLGSLLVLSALAVQAACGEETEPRADDPPTQVQTDAADPQVVDIVSGSAAGGDVSEAATPITDEGTLRRYLRQFRSPAFVEDLTTAIDAHDLADGRVLGLAVIEISCDEPPSAEVTQVGGRFLVTAGKVVSPHPECYAPVTSVAVLDLPE